MSQTSDLDLPSRKLRLEGVRHHPASEKGPHGPYQGKGQTRLPGGGSSLKKEVWSSALLSHARAQGKERISNTKPLNLKCGYFNLDFLKLILIFKKYYLS